MTTTLALAILGAALLGGGLGTFMRGPETVEGAIAALASVILGGIVLMVAISW